MDCACVEYLYLNDIGLGEVHKFAVDPTNGSLTEIPGPGGAGTPWMSGFDNPHGIGADVSGRLYVADHPTNGPIYRVTCAGGTVATDATVWNTSITGGGMTNIGTVDNYILVNGAHQGADFDKIHVLDACTGDRIGEICLNDTDGTDWGMQVLPDGTVLVAHGLTFNGISLNKRIWRFAFDPALIDGACVDPIITTTGDPGHYLAPYRELYGVTSDGTHLYVVARNGSNGSELLKIDIATGALVSTLADPAGATGFNGARGLIYAPSSNRLYVAGIEDCIAIVNPDNMSYIGAGAGAVTGQSEPKAIGLLKECCPTTTPLVYTPTVCSSGNGERVLLTDLYNCGDGVICEGVWQEVQNTSGGAITFNDCDLSITVNGSGCAVYELTNDATTAQRCAPFVVRVEVCTEVPEGVGVGALGTCTNGTPNNDARIELTNLMNVDQVNLTAGTTYTGPDYGDAANTTVPMGNTTATLNGLLHATTYTVRLWHGENDCFTDRTVTIPTNDCVPVCNDPTVDVVSTTCDDHQTPAVDADDTFVATLEVSNSIGTNYQVVTGANPTDGTGGTVIATGFYGAPLDVDHNFLADGSSTYALTLRDVQDGSCFTSVTVGPVAGCSDCGPMACGAVQIEYNRRE